MPDFSGVQYYLLSENNWRSRNGPLAAGLAHVLSGGDGYFRPGDVMRHMTMLIEKGIAFDTHANTEVGRWNNLHPSERDLFPEPVSEELYYAWADPDYWDYDPHCVLYAKAEFMELFADCCRNYVAANPERREEFAQAMAANGMQL